MDSGVASYAVALVGFGAASGVDIVAQRRFVPLLGTSHLVASLAGLADLGLIIAAFFLMSLSSALIVNVIGAIGTVWLAKASPSAPAWVMIYSIVGCAALAVHFA